MNLYKKVYEKCGEKIKYIFIFGGLFLMVLAIFLVHPIVGLYVLGVVLFWIRDKLHEISSQIGQRKKGVLTNFPQEVSIFYSVG